PAPQSDSDRLCPRRGSAAAPQALSEACQSASARVAGSTPSPFRVAAGVMHPLTRSEEHTSELQSRFDLVCRLLLEKKKNIYKLTITIFWSAFITTCLLSIDRLAF